MPSPRHCHNCDKTTFNEDGLCNDCKEVNGKKHK